MYINGIIYLNRKQSKRFVGLYLKFCKSKNNFFLKSDLQDLEHCPKIYIIIIIITGHKNNLTFNLICAIPLFRTDVSLNNTNKEGKDYILIYLIKYNH